MALYYNLGAVCADPAAAEIFMACFRDRAWPSPVGPIALDVVHTTVADGILVGVWPRGMAYASPKGSNYDLLTDEAKASALAWFLDMLKTATGHRAAFFGAEAYDYFLDSTVAESLEDGGHGGLVVAEAEAPAGMEPFAAGYRWRPATPSDCGNRSRAPEPQGVE